jgi:predicted phage replisome organizer
VKRATEYITERSEKMADVKWIKITTDIFDDDKILLIESLPEADSVIVIWFKLLCLAGKQNNSGVFMMGDRIAYTDKMLATIFRRKESTVQLALQTFEQFGMIELIDGIITIPNWGKHQSLDQLESKKEYMKKQYGKTPILLMQGIKKVFDVLAFCLGITNTEIAKEAEKSGICDFSGQGREKRK